MKVSYDQASQEIRLESVDSADLFKLGRISAKMKRSSVATPGGHLKVITIPIADVIDALAQ
jgi:hypothetical protein